MVLVALAILVGHFLLVRRARGTTLDASLAPGLSASMLVGGLVFGHLVKLLYVPDAWHLVTDHPATLIQIFAGQASFAYLRWNGVRGGEIVRWLDLFASVFPSAWIFGRLHCYLVHDHPGMRTTHWLGVRYPDGARWDLALLEILVLIPFIPLLPWALRRARPGWLVGGFLIAYGVFRFLIDYFHVDAVRYLGATVDTWASVAAVALGLMFCLRGRPSSGLR
jgi:phosphatidylglycerol:prolipoprotein diacylglycerol transferase